MAIGLKSRSLDLKTPQWLCLLAGASSVALTAMVLSISMRPVQTDARSLQPISTASASPAVSATPAPLVSGQQRHKFLHGLASWYGEDFDGQTTASGEPFDMNAMTACHPTLPFGSIVRVINRLNHHSVIVRITDRGNLYKGRIIDLSYAAAKKLAMVQSGLAPVDVEVISLGGARPTQ